MAEPISLAVGVISLAGLFNNAIADFEYIQLGKDFAKDFEICRTKLQCQQLRLSRWGAAVGINKDVKIADSLNNINVEQSEVAKAEECLGNIVSLFEEYRSRSSKYTDKRGPQELAGDNSPDAKSLLDRMHGFVEARQKKTGTVQKMKWALYERKHFDRLHADIKDLVAELVGLWPGTKKRQQELCHEEVAKLVEEPSVSQLQDIISGEDKDMEDAFDSTGGSQVSLISSYRRQQSLRDRS
jgi:hypothetical protein